MKYQRAFIGGMLAIGGVLAVRIGYAQEAPANAPLPAWKPQPKLMRFLSSLTRLSGYAIQPPRGYALQQTQREGMLACGWKGNAPKNRIAPALMLTMGQVPFHAGKKMTPEQLLTASLDAQKRRYADWTQTAFERGQINGLVFARAYWTATQEPKKQKLRGVSYFAVDGNAAILLAAQDADGEKKPDGTNNAATRPELNTEESDPNSDDFTPPEVDRLQLAEAAIQTFHRGLGFKAPSRPATPAPAAP